MYFIRSLSRIFRFLPCFLQRLMETQKVNISFPENVYFVREIIGQTNTTLLPIRKEERRDLRTTNYVFDVWRKITLAATVRRKKIGFYCQGLHNSAICTERNKRNENQNTATETGKKNATSFVSNLSSVLLQTADLIVGNTSHTK